MTVQEFQARRIEQMGRSLAYFAASTAADKLDWSPAVDGSAPTRSILEMIGECVLVNRFVAALLRGETLETPRSSIPPPTFADVDDAQKQLIESADELAAAIRRMPDEGLTATYPHWRGPMSGEKAIEGPYRNMAYHAGQVNYIQILAGDDAFHVPPTWI